MSESLKSKTVNGVLWSFVEQISTRGSNFVTGIIIARVLSPTDYGLMGMLGLFIALSQLFIDGGLTSALIRTKNPSEKDFSTVYIINIVLSVFFYFLLFFCAPIIASFYDQPLLKPLTRAVALVLVIASVASIQGTLLTIRIDFRTKTYISFFSSLISGIIGIICAYRGWGVWALVAQSIISATMISVLTIVFVRWIPRLVLSKDSFLRLFSYSSKLLAASCLRIIYDNSHPFVIGKLLSPADVGLYSRGGQFPGVIDSTMTGALNRVAFPVLSKVQDNNPLLLSVYEKYIQLFCFLVFPIMMILCGCAKPLISLLLKDHWLACVPLMQILCFANMTYGISMININLLYVKGRSDLVLRLEIQKKIIAFLILFSTMFFNLKVICCGQILYAYVGLYLNTRYTKKLLGYSIRNHLKSVIPYFILSLIVLFLSYSLCLLIKTSLLAIIVSLILCAIVYLLMAKLLNLYAFREAKELIRERFHV